MSADFSRLLAHLAEGLERHATADGLTGVRRAVFLARGGHAPGDVCPSEPRADPHAYWCASPDDECNCRPDPVDEQWATAPRETRDDIDEWERWT